MSEDGGRTFAEAEGFPTEGVKTLLPLPQRPGEALLGMERRGVWKITGGGAEFHPSHQRLVATAVASVAFLEASRSPLFAAVSGELLKTADQGSTWEPAGLEGVSQIVAAPGSPNRLYAVTNARIARSEDGGTTWELSAIGATGCVLVRTLAVAPSEPDTLLTTGMFQTSACGLIGECGVFKSTDGGRSFTCAGLGPDDLVLFDPRNPDIAYSVSRGALLRTTNGGEQWRVLHEAPAVAVLAVSPRAPAVLWAGTREGEVWKSPDRGDTWLRTPFPVPEIEPPPRAVSLTFDPRDPDTVYVVLDRIGVFATRDSGSTWELVGQGLPGARVAGALAVDRSDPRRLFAGTLDRGVYRLLQIDTSPCVADGSTLCLDQGRFEVKVAWEDFGGGQGVGHGVPQTADSGWFWFFDPANVELLVKVIDGRVVNDNFWFFYGSLSNVQYTITVRDTATGEIKIYSNLSGRFASAFERGWGCFLGAVGRSAGPWERQMAGGERFGPPALARHRLRERLSERGRRHELESSGGAVRRPYGTDSRGSGGSSVEPGGVAGPGRESCSPVALDGPRSELAGGSGSRGREVQVLGGASRVPLESLGLDLGQGFRRPGGP